MPENYIIVKHGTLIDGNNVGKDVVTTDFSLIAKELADRYKNYCRVIELLKEIKEKNYTKYQELVAIAKEIKRLQKAYRKLVLPYNKTFCATCPSCCCHTPQSFIFSEDYIYYALLGEILPTVKLRKNAKYCMFLGKKGCILPAHLRPRLCITANKDCFYYARRGFKPMSKQEYQTLVKISSALDVLYRILRSSVEHNSDAWRTWRKALPRL